MARSGGALLPWMLLFISLCGPCHSIYEDQVGVWDWHQQYIGKVKHATFQTQGSGRKRVVVGTEENVLASLNLRKGEIFWKHVVGCQDSIDGLDIALGKYVITLSSNGTIIRAWHLPDGQLVWETFLQAPGSSPTLLVTSVNVPRGRGTIIMVLGGNLLHAISSIDGELLWTANTEMPSEDGKLTIRKIIYMDDKSSLHGVGFAGSEGFSLWDIDEHTGNVHVQTVAKFDGKLSTEVLVVTAQTVVALDVKGDKLICWHIASAQPAPMHAMHIKDLVTGEFGPFKLLEKSFYGIFALEFSNKLVLVKVGHPLEVFKEFEGTIALSDGIELPDKKAALAVVQQSVLSEDLKVSLHVLFSDGEQSSIWTEVVEMGHQRGLPRQAHLNSYIRTDRSFGFRVLVVTEDDSLSLLQQEEVVWNREDGLASIVGASTCELPVEKGVSVAQVEHGLIEWLKGHVLKLKATLLLASVEEMAAMQALRLNNAEKTKMSRDHNGFRKLLIVLTKAGKIYALHTGDGRIVWSLLIPSFQGFTKHGESRVVLKLLPWQVPHKHALDENPVFLVAGQVSDATGVVGTLAWIDAATGEELNTTKLTYSIDHIIPLPLKDSSEQQLHLIIDEHANAHLFPYTDESLSIFLKHAPNTYFYMVDKWSGIITGYAVKDLEEMSGLSLSDGIFFRSQKLWTVVFPSESERITLVVTRRSDEVVHTQAKVLTNQDVLYKYLNKNTLFVVTVAPKGSGAIGEASPEEAWLVAYIIDTVTGRVLHRVKHPNAQGPVHAVFSENWVVYHYFNLQAYRFEMSVLEVYDTKRVDNGKVLQLVLGRHNGSSPVSSYSHVDLDVRMQSYFFSRSIKAMTVTSTARGITGKQVLVGTVGDQVLALDKRLFDPRRTLNPTPAEREDGVLPLSDSIDINPQSYLTHAYTVDGLRGILTVPASLESTSLVFAYGVDLFYTHTAPSRTYDSLTEDFSYALLLITIIVLVVAIITTWILSERKELQERWK